MEKPIIITINSHRGGSGKSTITQNLAAALQENGKKVLVIDCDPQSNTSATYGTKDYTEWSSVFDLFSFIRRPGDPHTCIQHTDCGDIISGDPTMDQIEALFSKFKPESKYSFMKPILKSLNEYDYIINDTNPNTEEILFILFSASDYVLCPWNDWYYSQQSAFWVNERIKKMKEYNPDLKWLGFLMNNYSANEIVWKDEIVKNAEIFAKSEGFNTRVLNTKIRRNTQINIATNHHTSAVRGYPKSNGAEDYRNLANEIIGIVGE